MAPRFIARQLANPHGWFGRVIGRLMNFHNARMNAFAVRELDPGSFDRVLEIGFGGGTSLPPLINSGAFIAGIDRSHAMVARARHRFRKAIAAGKATFLQGRVEAMPFATNAFDKACTVNTVYFWPSLEGGFAEIFRVLAPDGRLAVGFLPKEYMDRMMMPTDIFTTRTPSDIFAALRATGFDDVRVGRPQADVRWCVVSARRP